MENDTQNSINLAEKSSPFEQGETISSLHNLGRTEFIILCATLICLVALAIDAILPALQIMGNDLGVENDNDNQMVISIVFAGLALGQLVAGPLSDTYGRKPVILGGLVLFLIGCIISINSRSFEGMLIGRFLQGLGVSAPRIVSIAMVRDLYHGRSMAQIMSFVMAVFIIVPALAPALGQIVLFFAGWRMIFLLFIFVAFLGFLWLSIRQKETLSLEKRLPFSARQLWKGMVETCTNRISIGYTIAAGIIFGSFIGYLNSAQQIFQDIYGLGDQFPLYFAGLALAIGCASLTNGKLVMKYGMRRLLFIALIAQMSVSILFFVYISTLQTAPSLLYLMIWGSSAFFCTGILFGNFNALALEPMGHIAGLASAIIGAFSTFISVGLGGYIGYLFNGTVIPLVGGFGFLSLAGFIVVLWSEGKLFPTNNIKRY